MKKYLLILFILPVLFLSSCKKEEEEEPFTPLTADQVARNELYNVMKTYYLWYKLMPTVDKEIYPGPRELLAAMRYKELDRWSYVQKYDDYQKQSQAIFVGHGIRMGLDVDKKVRIVQIYNNSPMYNLGVRRGWIIKKVNDTEFAPIFISGDGEAYYNLIGPSTAGITNKFLFQTPEGKDSTITTTKAQFTINLVIHYDTLHLKTGITGHLVFEQFEQPANAELERAFSFFKANNINNIIVDLRYNGGGDLTVLLNLAAHIGGSSKFGKPFLTQTHNDQLTSRNQTYNFGTVTSPVKVGKMIVITTRSTGSASEQLINGLKPFMEIKTIGDTTGGKPVGMYGIQHLKAYMFWPISYKIMNTAGEGDFYDGFSPDKYVPDDITHDWRNRKEACLKEAIYLLENGSVSAKSAYDYHRSVQFSESPERLNNAYFIEK